MSAITEEDWKKAFKSVREQFEIDNLLPEQENSLREFLGGQNIFADGLREIFDFPVPSDRCRCSVRKASWFQCSRCNIAIAIAYGRPYSLAKPDRDKYDNRDKKQLNLQQLITQPGPA